MPSLPLRIAVLETDRPIPIVDAKYNGYGGVFTSLLYSSLPLLSPPLQPSDLAITAYDVLTAQEYPSLDDIDAVLITGSRYNCFDNDPWIIRLLEFCKKLLEQRRVRVVGVCFGHQILARALGSKTGRNDEGWELSVVPVELTEKGKEIFGLDTMLIHQMHRDIVFDCPPGVETLAYTSKCAVQTMYIPKLMITVQGHPEFDGWIARELVEARHKQGIFDDELYNDAIQRVDEKQDGRAICAAFLKFLLEE